MHELSPLVFKRFSITLHYSVMMQMILAFINTFQIEYLSFNEFEVLNLSY